MRLTVYTDYSLRVLIFAALHPERVVTIDEIAHCYAISRNHLTKVVHRLGLRGYLDTVRGKGGGLRLALPPARICIGEVVRATEEDLALVECFRPAENRCRITPACTLRSILQEAIEAFLDVLDGYTLAELITNRGDLLGLLDGGLDLART